MVLGLVKAGNKTVILTDIAGLEDHFGDMDFWRCRNKNGVTAVQMDLKLMEFLELLKDCLAQPKKEHYLFYKISAALTASGQSLLMLRVLMF